MRCVVFASCRQNKPLSQSDEFKITVFMIKNSRSITSIFAQGNTEQELNETYAERSFSVDSNGGLMFCRYPSESMFELACSFDVKGCKNIIHPQFSSQTLAMYTRPIGFDEKFSVEHISDETKTLRMSSLDMESSRMIDSKSKTIDLSFRQNSYPFVASSRDEHDFRLLKINNSMNSCVSDAYHASANTQHKKSGGGSSFILDALLSMGSFAPDESNNNFTAFNDCIPQADQRCRINNTISSRTPRRFDSVLEDQNASKHKILSSDALSILGDALSNASKSSSYSLGHGNNIDRTKLDAREPTKSHSVKHDLSISEASSIPLDENGCQTSIGSINHDKGTCRPCAFCNHPRKKKCNNGIYCLFCHFKHPKKGRRKKGSKQILEMQQLQNSPIQQSFKTSGFALSPRFCDVKRASYDMNELLHPIESFSDNSIEARRNTHSNEGPVPGPLMLFYQPIMLPQSILRQVRFDVADNNQVYHKSTNRIISRGLCKPSVN